MNTPARSSVPWSKRLFGVIAIALSLGATTAAGAGPPEVVRLRVPSARVRDWFPPGTELRGLTSDEFEALVKAGEREARRQPRLAPRVVQARHSARWDSGVLVGSSELVVEASGPDPAEVVLDPWTPAIDAAGAGALPLRVGDGGRTAVRVHSTEQTTVVLKWQLRARPHAQGRGFTLGLPDVPSASLTLDLPARWAPTGLPGLSQGPLPSPVPGLSRWRFDGRGGTADLRFHDPEERESARAGWPIWVSGPTRVDLREVPPKPNWTANWTVDVDRRGPRRFTVELDPGLELLNVTGPGVKEFRVEPRGQAARVVVSLSTDVPGPTPVLFSAHAKAPADGPWSIPAARPVDALWIGGVTSVRLDPSRILQDCRERSGRRVLPRLGETADPNLLVFEARTPETAAELVFRKPWNDVSAEVRGQLLIGSAAPRLKSQLTWTISQGRLLHLDVELPPGWIPDVVQIEGVNEPTVWHGAVQPSGATRVHVLPPALESSQKTLVLNLAATATVAGGRGPLSLPRVRPLGARVSDERWASWTEPGMSLQPTSARGLAWIDHDLATEPSLTNQPATTGALSESLAWRWLADDGEARVVRERAGSAATASIRTRVQIDPDRLRLESRIKVDAGDEWVRSLPIALADRGADVASWRFKDETTGGDVGARPLDDPQRTARGFAGRGEAYELVLPQPRHGKIAIQARHDAPWTGAGRIPLVALPDRFAARGIVAVFPRQGLNSTVKTADLTALDPSVVARSFAAEFSSPAPTSRDYRNAYAFRYEAAAGRLELKTENLATAGDSGVVRDAVLTTYWNPEGRDRHLLSLRTTAGPTQTLDLSFPPGTTLVKAGRDAQPVEVVTTADGLSLSLASPDGSRSNTTIDLEYRSDRSSSGALVPTLPKTSWPCLAFTWQVVAPELWGIDGDAPGLVDVDPSSKASWSRRAINAWRDFGRLVREGLTRRREPEGAYSGSVDRATPEEIALGDWLTRWDAGPTPVVVDRLTLASSGWGPNSRIVTPATRNVEASVAERLRPYGLTAVELGGALLVTTPAENPERPGGPLEDAGTRAAWQTAVRQAVVWGTDASDRFLSAALWRDEGVPDERVDGESTDRAPFPQGWRVRRYNAPGWPPPEAAVQLVNERTRAAWSWTLGLSAFTLGVACRRARLGLRLLGVSSGLGLSVGLLTLGPAWAAPLCFGMAAGTLAALFHWIGRAWPRRAPAPARGPSSRVASSARLARAAGSAVMFVLVGAALQGTRTGWAQPDREDRILALFPFDGDPDPDKKPDRAVLRLRDFDKLNALARPVKRPGPLSLAATAARHHVARENDGSVIVESEYDLVGPSEGQAAWTFPIEKARDLSATLDGRPASTFVPPGGRTASVALTGIGPHRLRLRRNVLTQKGESGATLKLPVNAMASALVDMTDDRRSPGVEIVSARGKVERTATGLAGLLGPADQLVVFWPSPNPSPAAPVGSVEGILLWDAEPGGDRVRALLTCRNPEGTAALRLRLSPGLVVGSTAIPGYVDSGWEGTAERPEWVAHFEPSLPDGNTLALEFWRTAPAPSPELSRGSPAPVRSLPLIEPLGVKRYSGALAYRRPSDWSGRLPTNPSLEPITEEEFVKLRKTLPETPLTLSGVTRFVGAPNVALVSGPTPNQLAVQSVTQLRISPGRIDLQVKAELAQTSGGSDRVALEVPSGLRLISVEATGLTDWSQTERGRIHLQFDGTPGRRTVQIQGWIVVSADPLATGVAKRALEVPWIRWVGLPTQQAMLAVESATPCQLDPSPGIVPISAEPAPAGAVAASGPSRLVYRVDDPDKLGKLRWELEPPRLSVSIQSQLAVNPQLTEWTALLRYEVSGGAIDAFHLKLPSRWADRATIKVIEGGHRLASETKGETTYWTIRPDRPVWGSLRVLIRAAVPTTGTEPISFPDVLPLGRGAAETYLAIVNGTPGELVADPSTGLLPIDYATRFRDETFLGVEGTPARAYRVKREGWTLKIRAGAGSDPAKAAVSLADLACTVSADGSVLGKASYELEAGTSPGLAFNLPPNCRPLCATVNEKASPVHQVSAGRWRIPLQGESPCRVALIWSAPGEVGPTGGWAVVPPSLDPPRVPSVVSVRAADSGETRSAVPSFEPTSRDVLEFERVAGIRRRIVLSLPQFHRGSLREREDLITALIAFELKLRAAERSVVWDSSGSPASRDDRIRAMKDRARSERSTLAEALRAAGLDEFLQSASVQVGNVGDPSGASPLKISAPADPIRVSKLGRPRSFRSESPGPERPPTFSWKPAPAQPKREMERAGLLALAALTAPAVAVAFKRRIKSRKLRAVLAFGIAGAVASLGGPWTLGIGLIAAGLGRATADVS